ncbi:similar to Saccharomyces cerevisiae YGL029W CGR1 Protein involved in nucleolar integrity and processing of the pre-rRNA for the 60S ribosome subunit [Geotrichum candidum]|uniref:rRNA-processing protein n=1 Tax=Geotrichum candidum TaxID=1173061 RepID=A0A0J9X8D7_GEOCN|nr:similar to Saccharomyces cerevisiae YGL029W CGR1 Protein involved in nucleolar integrity and processing of the pre-rRNA for the 60S ribosome subunit [Geotrichum candidum]
MSKEVSSTPIEGEQQPKDLGIVKSGRVWKEGKKPLRVRSLGISKTSTWEKRQKDRLALKGFKEKARELKEEKEQERKRVIEARKAHKLAKEEKERYELLAKKMHAKKLERLRKKEKRNKLLKER